MRTRIMTPTTRRRACRNRALSVAMVALSACQSDGAAQTAPSADARILSADQVMSDGSAVPIHQIETLVTSAPIPSGGLVGGMSVDAKGNVYSADFEASVWRIAPDGEAWLLNDEFTSASGNLPLPDGSLLQGEWTDNVIFRIAPDGSRTVFSDSGLDGPVGIARMIDGDFVVANWRGGYLARVPAEGGPAVELVRDARMNRPNGVVVDGAGNVYVSDLEVGSVFRWTPGAGVTILAELPGRGNAHAAIAGGGLYVNKIWDHVIYRVDLETEAYGIVAGTGRAGYDDGPTGSATIEEPNGIATAPGGEVIYFNTHRGVMGRGNPGTIILRRLMLPE